MLGLLAVLKEGCNCFYVTLDSLIGAGTKGTEPHQLRRNCGQMTLRRDISSGLDETNEAFGAIARSLSLQEIVRGAEYKQITADSDGAVGTDRVLRSKLAITCPAGRVYRTTIEKD